MVPPGKSIIDDSVWYSQATRLTSSSFKIMAIVILQVDRSVVTLSCYYAVSVNSRFMALHATDPVAIATPLIALETNYTKCFLAATNL